MMKASQKPESLRCEEESLSSLELSELFLKHFETRGYKRFSCRSVVPRGSSDLLFVSAGIVTVQALLKKGGLYTSIQRCVRVSGKHNDLEEVGKSPRHHTSFEMAGHFKLPLSTIDDKKRVLVDAIEFLESVGLKSSELTFTYHPEDADGVKILSELGLRQREDPTNIGSAGERGDRGYSLEIYAAVLGGECEVGNCVYVGETIDNEGKKVNLKQPYLDSGMGLLRLAAALKGHQDTFVVSPDRSVLEEIASDISKKSSEAVPRMVLDHLRTTVWAMDSGVDFGNVRQGYVLRKLFRKVLGELYSSERDRADANLKVEKWTRGLCRVYEAESSEDLVQKVKIEADKASKLGASSEKLLAKVGRINEEEAAKLIGEKGVPANLIARKLAETGIHSFNWQLCQELLQGSHQHEATAKNLVEKALAMPEGKVMILPMIAYTSGFLHAGHGRPYGACDVLARWLRMRGANVMLPFGFDSHGLPTELKAREEGMNPVTGTDSCARIMRKTCEAMRFSFDGDLAIDTSKPSYYMEEQEIFVRLWENGFIERKSAEVFGDPSAQTTLAAEQVENGRSERTGAEVETRNLEQGFFKLSLFAKDLHGGLSELKGSGDQGVLARQKEWIGYIEFTALAKHPEIRSRQGTCNAVVVPAEATRPDSIAIKTRHLPVIQSPDAAYPYTVMLKDLKGASVEITEKDLTAQSCSKLRDWCISRQRSFGCPIPAAFCVKCGGVVHRSLVAKSPITKSFYTPKLKELGSWSNVKCPKCSGPAERDCDTLDVLFDSSWYPIKYCGGLAKLNSPYLPTFLYIGGAEHSTGHLLYIRAVYKALAKTGLAIPEEPILNFAASGLVHARTFKDLDGKPVYADEVEKRGEIFLHNGSEVIPGPIEKMSKSKKNVVRLDTLLSKHSADAVRLSLMSDYPLEGDLEGSGKTLEVVDRLISRLRKLFSGRRTNEPSKLGKNAIALVKELDSLYGSLKFNRVVAKMHELSKAELEEDSAYVLLCVASTFLPDLSNVLGLKTLKLNL